MFWGAPVHHYVCMAWTPACLKQPPNYTAHPLLASITDPHLPPSSSFPPFTTPFLLAPTNSEELNRPENASLKPLVEKLRRAKETIDAGRPEGQDPLSWADLLVLAARTTVQQGWREIKVGKGGGSGRSEDCKLGMAAGWIKVNRGICQASDDCVMDAP